MPAERRAVRRFELLITCEHGGNRVPRRYRRVFARAGRALASHEGYDPGALQMARDFARRLRAPLYYSTTTRLLVELNASLWHPRSFSRYSRRLSTRLKNDAVERYYLPYRAAVREHVARALRRGRRVVHVSCHTFTPRLRGEVRRADVGLLFDPAHGSEATYCSTWAAALKAAGLHVRRNYPYRGRDDGLTTDLRARFGGRYCGIELEVNQRFPKGDRGRWNALRRLLVETLPR